MLAFVAPSFAFFLDLAALPTRDTER